MNLSKLFETQRKLDERILKEKGLEGQELLDKKILALQVELGELANEHRHFKFWSEDREPRMVLEVFCKECQGAGVPVGIPEESGVDCWKCEGAGSHFKNPLLEEYVDCLHFILSIGIEFGHTPEHVDRYYENNVTEHFLSVYWAVIKFADDRYLSDYDYMLGYFLGLGRKLDFSWDQIEQAYYEKNAENHRRQEVGY